MLDGLAWPSQGIHKVAGVQENPEMAGREARQSTPRGIVKGSYVLKVNH